jgi:DNA repair ATPase RecN
MKKVMIAIALSVSFITANAQGEEAEQLILNVEKLAQFKKILKQMKDAYKIIFKGYTAVRDISQGNFKLHKAFLDALMDVSPAVKKYKRITDIFNYQQRIIKEYKGAFAQFKSNKQFTAEEINYLSKVYSNLANQSLKSLEELAMVITAGKLRMSDDERLQAIDKVYDAVVDQFSFLKEFNGNTALLSLQRKAEQSDIELSKRINGIK